MFIHIRILFLNRTISDRLATTASRFRLRRGEILGIIVSSMNFGEFWLRKEDLL